RGQTSLAMNPNAVLLPGVKSESGCQPQQLVHRQAYWRLRLAVLCWDQADRLEKMSDSVGIFRGIASEGAEEIGRNVVRSGCGEHVAILGCSWRSDYSILHPPSSHCKWDEGTPLRFALQYSSSSRAHSLGPWPRVQESWLSMFTRNSKRGTARPSF